MVLGGLVGGNSALLLRDPPSVTNCYRYYCRQRQRSSAIQFDGGKKSECVGGVGR